MRRLFWMIMFFGGYVWVVTSGNDEMILEKGKQIYKAIVVWLDGAEIDFQLKKDNSKKRSRRWD